MSLRRPVFLNSRDSQAWPAPTGGAAADEIALFHQSLPQFAATPITRLDDVVAIELGFKAVYVKDESSRLGLPSFKILGASWGVRQALVRRLGLDVDAGWAAVRDAARAAQVVLFAATDGNHGRAVARMAALLGVSARIYLPAAVHEATAERIRQESGADVVRVGGEYDAAVLEAASAARHPTGGGILIQDYDFAGSSADDSAVAQWIVDGYTTMLREIDEQMDRAPDLVVVPVGVGSLAQAVVAHYGQPERQRQQKRPTRVMAVEPDTAACLWKSLQAGKSVSDTTCTLARTSTIMEGLNCGTLSRSAWPLLQAGIDASATVSDYEAHGAAQYLQAHGGLHAGPCGAAPLAALRRLTDIDRAALGLGEDAVIVLLCTEGARDDGGDGAPHNVAMDDAVALTQTLVQINSANPSFATDPAGPGETAVARYITAWLAHRDIESHWVEPTPGRPSVVGVVRGLGATAGGGGGGDSSGKAKTLMLNGHIDTVAISGYDGGDSAALSGHIEGARLYGRGAADMKSGVAAAMVALAHVKAATTAAVTGEKQQQLRGDVILAAVADEEAESCGTEDVLRAGWTADAAVITEPTNMEIIHAHKGFVWLNVDILGLAAHGSRPDLGVDAIAKAGYFLVEIDRYAQRLLRGGGENANLLDIGSVHASLVRGGVEASSYPARCTVTVERRTVAGETAETVRAEVVTILERLVQEVPDFRYECHVTFSRSPFHLAKSHEFARLAETVLHDTLKRPHGFGKLTYWTDAALLFDSGIPTLVWGPTGQGLHAKEEWVDTASIVEVSQALSALALEFCK